MTCQCQFSQGPWHLFFSEIIFWSLFSGKLASILWCLIFMMDLTNLFFFKTGCWWESTCIAVSWDNTPKATLLELTGVWQSLGLSVEGGLCGIAWAGCCPLTNPPSFLNTVKFTVLLSNKDRINHNPTGSLLCNTTIQGLLPLSRKCLPDIWISMAEPFPLMEPNDKNLAKAFSCGKP